MILPYTTQDIDRQVPRYRSPSACFSVSAFYAHRYRWRGPARSSFIAMTTADITIALSIDHKGLWAIWVFS